jgi:hypothetical protein
MTGRDYRLGRLDLVQRAERVDHEQQRARNLHVAGAGQDRRSGDQYRAALARETEASLRRSASWRNGQPLLEAERWRWRSSQGLSVAAGARLDAHPRGQP